MSSLGLLAALTLTVVGVWPLAPLVLLCLHGARTLSRDLADVLDARLPDLAELDPVSQRRVERLREHAAGFDGPLGDDRHQDNVP